MRLLNFDLASSNCKEKLHILSLLTTIALIFVNILQSHALDSQNNHTIPTSNQFQVTNSYPSAKDVCSTQCTSISLRELLYRNDTTSVCCWLMSRDKSHKIHIDVNLTTLLGAGSWAMVFDTHLHQNVK